MASVSGLKWFRASEFPRGVLSRMDPRFLSLIDQWRDSMGPQATTYPSPLAEGWVRTSGSRNSRHYAVDRLSDAGDLFPCINHRKAWMAACAIPEFGGIGIYYDTTWNGKPKVMFHLDTRPNRLLWARVDGEYIYPERSFAECKRFFELLSKDEPWKH